MASLSLVIYALSISSAAAQKFAYLSYDSVFTSMPDYAIATENFEKIRVQYDAEGKRVEQDFNSKYEEFLDGMRDFPQSILQKRQSELQELMEKNIAFKEESRKLLKKAKDEIFAPLHQKLHNTLHLIGVERGYAFIINTDNNSTPFINPALGDDITDEVKTRIAK